MLTIRGVDELTHGSRIPFTVDVDLMNQSFTLQHDERCVTICVDGDDFYVSTKEDLEISNI